VIARSTLDAFVDTMIPRDETPGALDAGVADAVLATVQSQPEVARLLETGLEALERASHVHCGRPFASASTEDRQALLQVLVEGREPPGWRPGGPLVGPFWNVARGLIVRLFYGSPAGWAEVGFPGPSVDRGGYRHTIVRPNPLGPA
jgi:Gluconate 2-dehydrogenase subunit 3